MAANPTSRRRWIGGLALLASAAMLVAGETVFKNRFSPILFLAWWLLCLLFCGLAIFIALVDLRVQRHQARTAERHLLESAIEQIKAEALDKAQRGERGSNAQN